MDPAVLRVQGSARAAVRGIMMFKVPHGLVIQLQAYATAHPLCRGYQGTRLDPRHFRRLAGGHTVGLTANK